MQNRQPRRPTHDSRGTLSVGDQHEFKDRGHIEMLCQQRLKRCANVEGVEGASRLCAYPRAFNRTGRLEHSPVDARLYGGDNYGPQVPDGEQIEPPTKVPPPFVQPLA
jgi:hypothetical protein